MRGNLDQRLKKKGGIGNPLQTMESRFIKATFGTSLSCVML